MFMVWNLFFTVQWQGSFWPPQITNNLPLNVGIQAPGKRRALNPSPFHSAFFDPSFLRQGRKARDGEREGGTVVSRKTNDQSL